MEILNGNKNKICDICANKVAQVRNFQLYYCQDCWEHYLDNNERIGEQASIITTTLQHGIRQIVDDNSFIGAVDVINVIAKILQDKADEHLKQGDKKGYAVYSRRANHLYKVANEVLTGYF